MKKLILLAALLALICLAVVPAYAQNMTVSNLGLIGKQDLLIYVDGVLVGQYNTTSTMVSLPDQDFQMVVRASTSSRWVSDPMMLFDDVMDLIITNWVALFMVFMLVGLCGLAWYGGRR